MKKDEIATAIRETFISANLADRSLEPAGLVDVLNDCATGLFKIGRAITPPDAAPGHDSQGGHVESLTEAVMGIEQALSNIADALNNIAANIPDALNNLAEAIKGTR